MPTFAAHDGATLAYHVFGEGEPVICVPGPMRASAYLGDLGGLSAHRRLVMLDLRGTGESAAPEDVASYRCDRLVDDLDALRKHLGLDQVDLLGHSGGVNQVVQYAAGHPERAGRLVLVTPSTRAVGIAITGDDRRETTRLRHGEHWFGKAFAALEAIVADTASDEDWQAIAPFYYGRWDEAAKAHSATENAQTNTEAAVAFGAEGAFEPDATRAGLAAFGQPVLLVAGEVDLAAPPRVVAEFAELFPEAQVAVQPGAAHYPWLDDADRFVAATAPFLA